MNKQQLVSFLEEIGASPRKSLSQNFLIDSSIIHKMIAFAEIKPGDQVLEIGPGPGAITSELLKAGAKVIAVEKDKLFAEHIATHPNLSITCEDILKFPFETLQGTTKVVSNIPFHITADILEKLCAHSNLFESLTLVVQKEVAEKIEAKPSTKQYGPLTLTVQYYMTLESTASVPPSSFYPAPSVDSTIIHLKMKPEQKIKSERFFPIIQKAFQQRRKMLSSSLKTIHDQIPELLTSLQISPKARPEELTFTQWIQFIEKMSPNNFE